MTVCVDTPTRSLVTLHTTLSPAVCAVDGSKACHKPQYWTACTALEGPVHCSNRQQPQMDPMQQVQIPDHTLGHCHPHIQTHGSI